MPRYFFNVLQDGSRAPVRSKDHYGTELEDLESAREAALKDIEDIRRQDFVTLDTDNWTGWSVEVSDESGTVLLVVPFVAN